MPPYLGSRVVRNEDARLLTGRALFVDDVQLPGMLHVAFRRSDRAHGRLRSVDVTAARACPGVIAVYTAADLGDYWQPGPLLVPPPPVPGMIFNTCTQVPLVRDKVRYAGEPVAMVVAESRYLAEDALAAIRVDIEPLPAVVDLEAALLETAPRLHDHLPSNLAAHVHQQKGDYAAARAAADVVVQRRFHYDRGAAAAIENRAVAAAWNAQSEELTIWDTTQAPIPIRNGLARMLGLAESQVRVVAPFVGGGFGPKIMMFYPEEVLVPWAARALGRPVKWTEDRLENFVATTQERSQIHDAEIALSRDGRILGVKDVFLHDTGAYDPYGLTVPINSQCTLLGVYRVPAYDSEFSAVFTTTPIVTPVRGAGRQHGVFVMERLLDLGARELGLDRVEIRRRNLLRPDEFPHDHGIIFQDFTSLTYDSGDYLPALDQAAEMIGYEQFLRDEQPRLRAEGRHVGIGIVNYVEGTGIGPYEGARVTVEPSGLVRVATGVGTQGQGHFTAFAQIVADALGVDVAAVRVVTGDTREFNWGTGTFASRGAVVAGTACHGAAMAVREKILDQAARVLGAPREQLELVGGQVRVAGSPESSISLGRLASQANPLRGAVTAGVEPGLEATAYFGPDRGSTANGVHAMIVEVDRDTATVKIKRYVVVHDCGHLINPMIVEGQIQGGVAHGIGNAFFEQLVFDPQGQLLTASFMDYLLPLATDVPDVEMAHRETPSPGNPAGLKGVGEAGCIATGALFAQAVEDALGGDVEIREIPLSPNRLFELIQAGLYEMKPAPFAYHRPDTLEHALQLLDEHGPEAKPLAGGQSLVPAMNFRLSQPPVLVDLNRIGSLAGIDALDDGGLRLGGMTRQRAVERSRLVAERVPLLAATMPWIAHPPIRTRGTIGGSLAHADPAAELPAVMLALGATIGVRSRAGARAIPAAEFFLGLFATALMPGELLVEVTIPPLPPGAGWAIDEIARRHGDFALAGVAAVIVLDAGGRVGSAAIALIGAHDRAVRATAAEQVLVGEVPSAEALRSAGDAAARLDADPGSDVHASTAYRRHLVSVLVPRVVAHAVSRAARAV